MRNAVLLGKGNKHLLRSAPLYIFGLLAIVSLYAGLSLYHISYPGLFYDEARSLPAAWGVKERALLWLGDIPILTAGYIGSLKIWIYFLVFQVFPPTIESIRIPNIVIFSFSLFSCGLLWARKFGRAFSLLAITFIGLNPNLIAFARADFLPFAISLFCKGMLFGVLFLWGVFRLPWPRLLILSFLLFLGIFHRADFLWSAIGLLAGAIFLGIRKRGFRVGAWELLSPMILFCVILVSIFLMSSEHRKFEKFGWDGTFLERVALFQAQSLDTMEGTAFFKYCLALGHSREFIVLLIITALLFFPLIWRRKMASVFIDLSMFLLVYFTTVLGLMFFIRQVREPWHFLSLEPFLSLAPAVGLCFIGDLGAKYIQPSSWGRKGLYCGRGTGERELIGLGARNGLFKRS